MTESDTPGVIAPPPLIYLAFLAAGWGLSWLISDPGLRLPEDIARYLAFGLIVGGVVVDGAAAAQFRSAGTRPEPWKPSSAVAVGGIYRISRNPMYVGFALIYAGLAVFLDSGMALILLLPCILVIDRFVIAREERYLEAKFGETYRAYKRAVRRWL